MSNYAEPKRILTTLEQHCDGLAGKISMWTYDGINYWWIGGHLWSCLDRTDDERGISRPWTPEEQRQIDLEIFAIDFLITFFLLLNGIVIWLAFQGG